MLTRREAAPRRYAHTAFYQPWDRPLPPQRRSEHALSAVPLMLRAIVKVAYVPRFWRTTTRVLPDGLTLTGVLSHPAVCPFLIGWRIRLDSISDPYRPSWNFFLRAERWWLKAIQERPTEIDL